MDIFTQYFRPVVSILDQGNSKLRPPFPPLPVMVLTAALTLIFSSGAAQATTHSLAANPQHSVKAPAAKPPAESKKENPVVLENLVNVTPEDLVARPQDYLNKNVKFNAKFFAFSNLALDYKPAFRSSKTYLSFLVLRPNGHVPLSELKLAMPVPKEKDPESILLATLKDGDPVEVAGKVFSTALDEPWMEVVRLKKLGGADTKTASADKSPQDKSKKPDTPDAAKSSVKTDKSDTAKPKE